MRFLGDPKIWGNGSLVCRLVWDSALGMWTMVESHGIAWQLPESHPVFMLPRKSAFVGGMKSHLSDQRMGAYGRRGIMLVSR